MKSIPVHFTLGKGHVAFFYNKMLYLKNRYELLYQECLRRGYKVQYYGSCWDGVPKSLMNDYVETERDKEIIKQRIKERNGKEADIFKGS